MRSCASLAVAALVALTPASGRAGASARLVYVRGPGAEACPAEAAVRAAVSTRLGYDPFFAWAHDTLFAEITRSGRTYHAAIKLVGDDNRLRGGRDLSVTSDDCSSVVDAMGLTISLTIDPSHTGDGAPHPVATSPPPQPTPTPATDPVGPPPPPPSALQAAGPSAPASPVTPQAASQDRLVTPPGRDDRFRGYVGVGALGSVGAEPSASVGATIFVGASWRLLSVDLEARGDVPTTVTSDVPSARVQAYLLAGSLVPCVRYVFAFGCPVLSVGRLDATSMGPTSPHDATDAWVGAGGRAGVQIELGADWWLRAYGEVLGTLRRETLLIGGANAYTFPPASGGLGAAIAWRFR